MASEASEKYLHGYMPILTWPKGRMMIQIFSDADQVMSSLSGKLIALKESLDSRVNVQTVFFSTRTLKAANKLGPFNVLRCPIC